MTHIDLPGPGEKMLIMGDVGSGKSSIIHALLYNLSGKKVSSDAHIVNTINKKQLYTEVAWILPGMKDPLIIKRGMKPAVFEVTGIKGALQKELKEELSKKIHITDMQVLLNTCVLSISKSLPFFSLKKQDRLNFLRNFVDTSRLDELSEKAKDINLDVNRKRGILGGEVTTIESQLGNIKDKLSSKLTINTDDIDVLSKEDEAKLNDNYEKAQEILIAIEYDYAVVQGMKPYDSNRPAIELSYEDLSKRFQ